MTRYAVYLEMDEAGRCMAHVLDLSGCFVRAPSRDGALSRVVAAIGEYHAWLRCHGEPAPPADDSIEIEVAGEAAGIGPFDFRSAAALYPPDEKPVTVEEMERHFHLMSRSRVDLLALVSDLPDEVLDWQPGPDSINIRRLLRHVGNAEEWYVSRLVAPESLPPEWGHDEDLPTFEFLEMERCTAVERLRRLTVEERSGVFYPVGWTDHPEEPWTARKALRRFLEHEREHTGQAREILAAWWETQGRKRKVGPRQTLLAALAVTRDELLAAVTLVPAEERASRPVCGVWTAKDVLAHVADWEWLGVEGLRHMAAGQPPEVGHVEDIEAWNRVHYEARRDQPWQEVWADLHAAREAMLEVLEGMSQADLSRPFIFPWGPEGTAYQWVGIYVAHDREHTQGLREEQEVCLDDN